MPQAEPVLKIGNKPRGLIAMINMQDTRTRILETAEYFLRTRGYSGFSYGDIADAVGTTKANVHHHFGTKADLSNLLLVKTSDAMKTALDDLAGRSSIDKLKSYVAFFENSIESNLVCLCGMLLAGEDGLPEDLREANQEFVEWQLAWLEDVMASGQKAGELVFNGTAKDQASFFYSAIQGTHIVAKSRKDISVFKNSMSNILEHYEAA